VQIEEHGNGTSTSKPLGHSGDWWRSMEVCGLLSHWFSRHLLALYIAYDVEGTRTHRVDTGFVLCHREMLFWATAGHVIDQVNEILRDRSCRVVQMLWGDGCEIPGAESVMVHDRNLMTYSPRGHKIDFGAVAILGLDAENIVAGGRAAPITEEIWRNIESANPDGYYLIGYRATWVAATSRLEPGGSVRWSIQADLSCIPLRGVQGPPRDAPEHCTRDEGAFYGRLLPFLDGEGYQPDSIKGMSGGPVFSVERDPDGSVRYRLFGIQSSWWSKSRVIRAEPIHRIIALMGGLGG
jgi:hypothetical protein